MLSHKRRRLIHATLLCFAAFDASADIYSEVTEEALRANDSPVGHPLPLASHWTTGIHNAAVGWAPTWQLSLIAEGHHVIPWFQLPPPTNVDDFYRSFDFDAYARKSVEEACAHRLPLVLVATQWELLLAEDPYKGLPADQNPDVVLPSGVVEQPATISPFGPISQWHAVGRAWTTSPYVQKLQHWCPNPVMVLFLSNNEAAKLDWSRVESEGRYLKQYGVGRSDQFKRKVVGDAWSERYRALQSGMRSGLNPNWRANARFVGYNAFGPEHMGRWWGWMDYSLYSPGRIDPSPLSWDGGSPSYYIMNSTRESDFKAWSPQNEFQNLVFMQAEARALNPRFWFELSVWDGYVPGGDISKSHAQSDNRAYFASLGQRYTPDRYRGFVQFGMWLTRPRAVREFRDWIQPRDENTAPYFLALVDAVDSVYRNATLQSYWRQGRLLPVPNVRHPYQNRIPSEYSDKPRWFILPADVNGFPPQGISPDYPANVETEIKVFSLALELGTAPHRSWLIYASSPLQNRTNVRVSIPGRDGYITLPTIAVGGSFYEISEGSEVSPIMP
jgi:hypothetical protein